MTKFEVVVYDKNGNRLKVTKQSNDADSLRKELLQSGFAVVSIKPASDVTAFRIETQNIKDTDIYQLFRELSVLTKSRVKIDRSLQILINSTRSKKLRSSLEKILQDIKAGDDLSSAFERTKLFNPLVVSLIRASEITGDLSSGFENAANYIKFQIQFKNELRSAMVYPMFLIFASFFTIVVILKFIVPKFFSVFPDIKPQDLPVVSKTILYLSQAVSINPLSVAVVTVAAGISYLLKKQGRLSGLSQVGYYLPVVRSLLVNLDLSRFFYSMHSMLSSGVDFIKAVELSSMTVQSKNHRQKLLSTIDEIKKGRSITEAFSSTGVLGQSTVAMISVGEESGNLEEIFFEIYSFYDENFKNTTKRLLTIMEPLIITVTGVVVGFIVISLILTVVTVTNVKL